MSTKVHIASPKNFGSRIISRLRYILTVHPCVTFNFVLRLQKRVTRHLKKWINAASKTCTEILYTERGWNLKSLSKLWSECSILALTQMHKSRDPSIKAALPRIKQEEEKRSSGHIRPSAEALQHLYNARKAQQLAREHHDSYVISHLQRRAPTAAKWWNLPSEADLAKEFSAALNDLNSEKLSRFAASVLTLTPLPSRTNLRLWGLRRANVLCPICQTEPQTTRHVLSGCKESLRQGRYTIRHDMLLEELGKHLLRSPHTKTIHLDIPGFRNAPAWLGTRDDLLRPDGLITLKDGSEFIIELTVPWEENQSQAHEGKSRKYNALFHERRTLNPRTNLLVFEVGARGSLLTSCRTLNLLFDEDTKLAENCRRSLMQTALRGSFIIWQNRESAMWTEERI